MRRLAGVLTVVLAAGVVTVGPSAVVPRTSQSDATTRVARPAITRSSVTAGPISGGSRVVITGRALQRVTAVTFGSAAARILSRHAPDTVTVLTPRHAAGAVNLRVATAYGRSPAGTRFTFEGRPTVSSLPTNVSQDGGKVHLDGANLTFLRTITVDGRAARRVGAAAIGGRSLDFLAPAHRPGSVVVIVTTAGGSVSTRLLYESTAMATVTADRTLDRARGTIVGLSCASTTFCVAIDDSDATIYDGVTWSAPSPVAAGFLTDVSCASPTWCLAIGSANGAIFDGSGWTPTDPGVGSLMDVSCPEVGRCVVVGNGGSAVLDDTGWHAVEGGRRTAVSCVGPSFCMAVSDTALVYLLDGSTWVESHVAAEDGTSASSLMDVSCSSQDECSVADLNGSLWRYRSGTWSRSTSPPSEFSGRALSCGGPDFCAISDDVEAVQARDGGTLLGSVTFQRPYYVDEITWLRVSCVSPTFCMAASHWGAVSQWNGDAWSDPIDVMQPIRYLTSVACAGQDRCFAGGEEGRVLPYVGGRWGAPVRVDPWGLARTSVACGANGLCATVSVHGDLPFDAGDGTAAVLTGDTWRPTRAVLAGAVALTCAVTRCVIVSRRQYSIYDASAASPSWSAPSDLPEAGPAPGGYAVSVACSGDDDCVATFGSGYSHFDGRVWSPVARISPQVSTGLVGCASDGVCLARNSGVSTFRSASGSWGPAVRTAPPGSSPDVAVACGGSTCLTLTQTGFQLYRHGTWTVEQSLPDEFYYVRGAACMPDGSCLIVRSDGAIHHVVPPAGS